jgi:phenylpropionate dioxygenase-like ring-hydroxylating dioxygenase large terminal subunit
MTSPATFQRDKLELPFLKDVWYVAGWMSEFEGPGPFARTIADEPLVLYRKKDKTISALADRCAHRWAPLSRGRTEGDDIRCMYHGVRFRSDGTCAEVPGQSQAAPTLRVRSYSVVERHQLVWVWLGDPARADLHSIPDLSMLDQPSRRIYQGSLDYAAHYSLICDNLLDLSHIGFLHEKTAGQPVVELTDVPAGSCYMPGGSEAKLIDRGVRAESWISGPTARSVALPKRTPDGDLWTRTDFLVPGIFISVDRMYPSGTANRCGRLAPAPELESLSDTMSIQAVTPISKRESRYFYSFGPRASEVDVSEGAAMWRIVLATFAEDVKMIEAQQKVIDQHPGDQMGGIAADRGFTLYRNLMKRLSSEEAAAARDSASIDQ